MKILIVNSSAEPSGGAERVALTSAMALAEKGHQVAVLAAHGPIAPELQNRKNLEICVANSGPPEPIKFKLQRLRELWPKHVSQFLEEQLGGEAGKETVIHFHSGYLDFSVPGYRQLAKSNLPLVYTHHDYVWACPLQGFYDYKTQAMCPKTGGSMACFTTNCVNSYLDKWLRFSRHVGTYQTSGIRERVAEHIFVSNTSYRKLAPYLDPKARHTVLANPADFVQSAPAGIQDGSPFAFVGRLTTEKDPLMLAMAARAVSARVRFIGDGPLFKETKETYPDADMVGWKSGPEVEALLGQSRALVMTSRWLEGAPLVLAEAFSKGIPAVVPSETAAAEFVENGKTGFVYESRNQKSLELALTTLRDTEVARRLGGEAYRRFWISPPNWEAHLSGLEAIYERALRDGGSVGRQAA